MHLFEYGSKNWPISPNISTTIGPIFANVSALVDLCTVSYTHLTLPTIYSV